MATQPTLWTLNGLSVELKIYRQKLAEQIATLPPDSVDGNSSRWLMWRVVEHLRTKAAGNKELDRTQEDARLKKAQADKLELQLAQLNGEIVKTDDVGEYIVGILMAFRSRMLALPKRLAPVLLGMKRTGDVQARIEADVNHALAELAGLDPEEMLKQMRSKYRKAAEIETDEGEDRV